MNSLIDSRQLNAFATLAKTGSFTVAAKELYLSQSAVSHSIKALEQDVGCLLFDRVGKKVIMTQAGEQLLTHTAKILREMEVARSSLRQLGRWGKSRLRVGASITACQYILPSALNAFQAKYPDCQVSVHPGDTIHSVGELRLNHIDLAIGLEPPPSEQVEFEPLFEDELQFLVGPLHPWASRGEVVREEIPRQNVIIYNKSSYTFRMIESYFRQEEMVLNTGLELGSVEAIKELVKLNLGISILAPWVARDAIRDRTVIPFSLGRRKLKRRWGILRNQARRPGLPEETFVAICRSATGPLSAVNPGAN